MPQLATITSKRQLTIPAATFRDLGLRKGQRVLISRENGKLTMEPALNLVEELAGSVRIPPRFKGLSSKKITQQAKKEYFLLFSAV